MLPRRNQKRHRRLCSDWPPRHSTRIRRTASHSPLLSGADRIGLDDVDACCRPLAIGRSGRPVRSSINGYFSSDLFRHDRRRRLAGASFSGNVNCPGKASQYAGPAAQFAARTHRYLSGQADRHSWFCRFADAGNSSSRFSLSCSGRAFLQRQHSLAIRRVGLNQSRIRSMGSAGEFARHDNRWSDASNFWRRALPDNSFAHPALLPGRFRRDACRTGNALAHALSRTRRPSNCRSIGPWCHWVVECAGPCC